MADTYWIDGTEVTKAAFEGVLNSLKELPHTWYCTETTEGGDTGYEGEDPAGLLYRYVAESTQAGSTSKLNRKS